MLFNTLYVYFNENEMRNDMSFSTTTFYDTLEHDIKNYATVHNFGNLDKKRDILSHIQVHHMVFTLNMIYEHVRNTKKVKTVISQNSDLSNLFNLLRYIRNVLISGRTTFYIDQIETMEVLVTGESTLEYNKLFERKQLKHSTEIDLVYAELIVLKYFHLVAGKLIELLQLVSATKYSHYLVILHRIQSKLNDSISPKST